MLVLKIIWRLIVLFYDIITGILFYAVIFFTFVYFKLFSEKRLIKSKSKQND